MTKRVFLHPPRSLIYDVRYVNIFMKVVLTTFMTPYENVVLYRVWFGPYQLSQILSTQPNPPLNMCPEDLAKHAGAFLLMAAR